MKLKTKIVGHQIDIDDDGINIKPITESYLEDSLFNRCLKAVKKDIIYFVLVCCFMIHSYKTHSYKFAMFFSLCFGFVLALSCIKIMCEIYKK